MVAAGVIACIRVKMIAGGKQDAVTEFDQSRNAMSTVADSKSDPLLSPIHDRYYYGFRDEQVLQPDGTYKRQRIALTLRDHLHPHEGDCFMEGEVHCVVRMYLHDVCKMRLQDNQSALVLSDTGVYWDDPELGNHSPDVTVIFGIRRQRPFWKSFIVADEGVKPHLLFEVVSPRYRKTDVVEKMEEYHRAGVPIYVILDRAQEEDPFSIKAYQWRPQQYVPLPLEPDGRLWLADLNLWLGVDGQRVRFFDGTTNEEIGDLAEKTAFANAEKARADALQLQLDNEKARAEALAAAQVALEIRLRELEAELARRQVQPPPS